MTRTDAKSPRIDEEQVLYARILRIGVNVGMAILLVTFALYVLGVVAPSVPVAELPKYWGLSAHEYLRAIDAEFLHHEHLITGWAWLSVAGRSDYLCIVGIAFLSAVTIVCYVGITPILVRKRDLAYAAMVVAECAVLVLAASGVLNVGH